MLRVLLRSQSQNNPDIQLMDSVPTQTPCSFILGSNPTHPVNILVRKQCPPALDINKHTVLEIAWKVDSDMAHEVSEHNEGKLLSHRKLLTGES